MVGRSAGRERALRPDVGSSVACLFKQDLYVPHPGGNYGKVTILQPAEAFGGPTFGRSEPICRFSEPSHLFMSGESESRALAINTARFLYPLSKSLHIKRRLS